MTSINSSQAETADSLNSDTNANPNANPNNFILTPPEVFPYKAQQLTARARITEQMASRILMLDGAMGTHIQNYKLEEADYRGERFANISQDVRGNNSCLQHYLYS